MGNKRGEILEELVVKALKNIIATDPILIRSIIRYDADNAFTDPRDIPDLQTVQNLFGFSIISQDFTEEDLEDPLSDGNWQIPFSPPDGNIPFAIRIDYDYTTPEVVDGVKNLNPIYNNGALFGFDDPSFGTQAIKVFSTNLGVVPPIPGDPPVFISQPNPSVTVVFSDTLTLTAIVTDAVSYQWYRNGVLLVGQTNTTLTIPFFSLFDAGTYVLKATNAFGTTDSNNAVVTYDAGIPVCNFSDRKSDFTANGSGRNIIVSDGTTTRTLIPTEIIFFRSGVSIDIKQSGADNLTLKDQSVTVFAPIVNGGVSNIYNPPFVNSLNVFNDN